MNPRSAWPQLLNTALGLWLLAAPAALGYDDPAATNDQIVGPVAATFAFVAVWETTRSVGRLNAVIGVWLLASPLVLGYGAIEAVNSIVVGLAMLAFALISGDVSRSYGGGWRSLR